MAISFVDACKFRAVSTGTGDFVVSAAVQGYQTPVVAGADNGATYRYRAESFDLAEWEVGYGIYTAGTLTLARTVLANHLGTTAKVDFTTRPYVGIVVLGDDIVTPDNTLMLTNKTFDTASNTLEIDGVLVDSNEGTGAIVRAESPTIDSPELITPDLGTPTSGDLQNCDNLPASGVTFTQSGTGATARTGQAKLQEIRTFEDFGAVGDGTTDDRAALQAAIDAAAAAGGGFVSGAPGKNYRCIISPSVTDVGLIIKTNVVVLMNKSQISLECSGSVYGVRLQSHSHIWGPGTVKTTVSTTPGSQNIWHSPISLGAAYGDVTSVGDLGNYINATRWSIRNLTIDSVRTSGGGYGISGIGGISHGIIDQIDYPDSSTMVGGINFDWGTVGAISSGDIPGSRTNFDAGTAYTVHPNNIVVTNIKIGNWSNSVSTPIRLSGVHAIRVENFEILQARAAGVFHTAGDCGYEFAQSAVKPDRHRGIVIKNGIVHTAVGLGYYVGCLADNVNLAVVNVGYSPLVSVISNSDIVLENLRTGGLGGAAASGNHGIYINYIKGATIRNCTVGLHDRGCYIAEGAERVHIHGGEYANNASEGIYVGNATVPADVEIDGANCFSNGTGGTFGGIALANGARHQVRNCRLGTGGEGFQDYGIDLQSCTDAIVLNNHVVATAASGIAYKLGTSTTQYGVLVKFSGNTASSATTYLSGVNIIPYEYYLDASGNVITMNRALKAALTGSTTPTAGAWKAGTVIFYQDPTASSFIGTTCVTAGSPGTWKTFGATSA